MKKLDEALGRITSKRASTRRRGYLELLELGEKERVLHAALTSSDAIAIDVACDAFFPEPPELLQALIKTQRGPDAGLVPRFHLPMGNYLYAEALIVEHYRGKGRRIPVDTIEGLGLAYMRGMAPAFHKLLDLPIENAVEELRPPAHPVSYPEKYNAPPPGQDLLSVNGSRVLAAMIALHRLDHPVEDAVLQRLHDSVATALSDAEIAQRACLWKVQWARFDGGHHDDLSGLVEGMQVVRDLGPDLATTLLKRARHSDLDALLALYDPVYFQPRGFVHWPLANHMEVRGLYRFSLPPAGQILVAPDDYARARHLGLAPPPWWTWQ
ncbi:MAG: hypothetical protein SF172_05605 [Burkholderiales bacterium]|nr:hypothetical protein [Burkholderiales bacterium]